MARRKSHAEQKMSALKEKADAYIFAHFDAPPQEILHSWSYGELILDIKDAEGNWSRKLWVPDDDTEIAGIRELA